MRTQLAPVCPIRAEEPTDKVLLSRSAVDHLAEQCRTFLTDMSHPSDQLSGLDGPAFVEKFRELACKYRAKSPRWVPPDEDDAAYAERVAIPILEECCAALTKSEGTKTVAVELTGQQAEVIEKLAGVLGVSGGALIGAAALANIAGGDHEPPCLIGHLDEAVKRYGEGKAIGCSTTQRWLAAHKHDRRRILAVARRAMTVGKPYRPTKGSIA